MPSWVLVVFKPEDNRITLDRRVTIVAMSSTDADVDMVDKNGPPRL